MGKRKREADGSQVLPRKRAKTIEDFFNQTDSQTGGATSRSSHAVSTGASDCDDVIALEQASDARPVHPAGAGGEAPQQQQKDEEECVVLDDELHSLGVSAVRSNEMVQSVIDKVRQQ